MSVIRAAIVGCGNIHQIHLNSMQSVNDVIVKTVCDIQPQRAKHTAEQLNCEYCTDFLDIIRDPEIDVVHICTPHYLHASMCIQALQAGKYVLVEKPMAMTAASALEIITASREVGGRLGVIFQNRYNDSTVALRQAIQSGQYGILQTIRGSVTWHRDAAYYSDDWHGTLEKEGGGVLINQAIHTLDLVQWLTQSTPVKVSGSVSNDSLPGIIEVEDSAHLFIQYANGMTSTFYATNAHAANSKVEIEAVMEHAVLFLRGEELYVDQMNDGGLQLLASNRSATGEKSYWGDSHRRQIEDFYQSVRNQQPITIDARQGYYAVAILDAAYTSSKTRKPVHIQQI